MTYVGGINVYGVGGDIIKSYLNKYDTMVWNVFIWSRRKETWHDTVKVVMNFWVT